MTFAPFTLSYERRRDLCVELLEALGADHIREKRDGNLIHGCLVSAYHQDQARNPTAALVIDKLAYHCFGCGAKGGLLWLIATVNGTTKHEARRWLRVRMGDRQDVGSLSELLAEFDAIYSRRNERPPMPVYSTRTLDPWRFVHPWLTTGVPELGIPGRGISEQTILDFQVGYDPMQEKIVLPHFWSNNLVGWQTRKLIGNGPKYEMTPEFPRDRTIYNYRPREDVLVVESIMSVLKHAPDIHAEATFGASVTDEQIALLAEHPRVVLWFDNDEAGWNGTESVVERLARSTSVYVVVSPYAEDPADFPTEAAQRIITSAVPHSIWRRPKSLISREDLPRDDS